MRPTGEVYSPSEIARAAGVPEAAVIAAIGRRDARSALIAHDQAVLMARALRRQASALVLADTGADPSTPSEIFTIFGARPSERRRGMPLALSGTLHAGVLASAILITLFGPEPSATTLAPELRTEPMRLVFLATPGPGGGGGGGGQLNKTPPPKARREGTRALSSPLPIRKPPPPIEPVENKPEPPPPPIKAEPLPIVVAPVVVAAADNRDRIGILEETPADKDSKGPGTGAGVGKGAGTGIGPGDGSGIGPGSGGGIGGGPYRPGSGIEPPRLLREVKAEYPDDARQRGVEGEVELEIVVRNDGSVGDVKILRGLSPNLNERAVRAVKQWRFSPAKRLGQPVDVIVEVAVEFKMR